MATRAFLLCGDDKAVHAVTQILDELEICFEHSSEPPFALKRLAVQRFDLLIVDCDNPQNATQVFNSARASNLNRTSIAIAIVEGKAGVPSAFRLGASLVLTKPVSLEQARNTLRTGIGMTRREAQEVKAPVPANAPAPPLVPVMPSVSVAAHSTPTPVVSAPVIPPPAPAPAALTPVATAPIVPVHVAKPPVVPAPVTAAPSGPAPIVPLAKIPELTPKPAVGETPASEKRVLSPRPASVSALQEEYTPALTNFADERQTPTVGTAAFAKAAAAATGTPSTGTSKFDSVFTGSAVLEPATKSEGSSAKAPPAEIAGIEDKSSPVLRIEDPLAEDDSMLDPVLDHGVPSFGAMGKASFAGGGEKEQRGGKGLLIAAVVLLLIAGGAYAAWMTQPAFRSLLVYEYGNVNATVAALRGQPQAGVAAQQPQPVPPPAPVQPVPQADGASSTDATTTPNADLSPTSNPPSAALIGPNTVAAPPATSPQIANANAAGSTQKSASIQPAKQDTAASHAAAKPALVATAASLPPSGMAKATPSDLVEVPEDYADDQVVHRVHAAYPKQALVKKLHGSVVLQAVINKQGKVDSLQLVSGDPLLAQAAAEAVKQWRYKPYAHNGEPADFQTRVTVDFKLP